MLLEELGALSDLLDQPQLPLRRPWVGCPLLLDFLEKADAWLPAECERVYAVVDNLNAHRAPDVRPAPRRRSLTPPPW